MEAVAGAQKGHSHLEESLAARDVKNSTTPRARVWTMIGIFAISPLAIASTALGHSGFTCSGSKVQGPYGGEAPRDLNHIRNRLGIV